MKGAFTFLAMLFFSALYTYLVGAQTSMLLVYMFVLCIPLSLLLTLPLRARFEVSVEIPAFEVEKDGVIKIKLNLRNNSFLPAPFVRINYLDPDKLILKESLEDTLSFSPFEAKSIMIKYSARHRGVFSLGLEKLCLKDYLGFFSFSLLRGLEAHQYTGRVTVLPRISDMKPSSKLLQGSDGRVNTRNESEQKSAINPLQPGEPGHEYREYQPGDPLHQVHWKLSAKIERLMVRQSEGTGASKLCFILDPFIARIATELPKRKRSSLWEDPQEKNRILEDKLLEILLSVVNMVIRLGRQAEIWLYTNGHWQMKNIAQKNELLELQRALAQYRFLNESPENNPQRLPLSSMQQQQKANRNYKGGDAILFTACDAPHLQRLLKSADLESITLRMIQIQESEPAATSVFDTSTSPANELLWVIKPDEKLSEVVF